MILLGLLLSLLLFPLFHCRIWLSFGQVGREEKIDVVGSHNSELGLGVGSVSPESPT